MYNVENDMSNNAMTDQKNLLDVLEKAVQERNELLSIIDRSNDRNPEAKVTIKRSAIK